MTLDEAIKHCEEKARKMYQNCDDYKCAKEHEQLAEWLRELKVRREADDNPPMEYFENGAL